MGLEGAGDADHVEILANALNQDWSKNNFDSANTLKTFIGNFLGWMNLHENIMNAMVNGYFTSVLRFGHLVLIGAKINKSFYLCDAWFGISGKDRVKTSSIVRIKKDYKAIISEAKFAYLCIPCFQSTK